MQRVLVGLSLLAACSRPAPIPIDHQTPLSAPTTAAPHPLCCCELAAHEPEDDPERFEARASACVAGTPATPEGTCVDWKRCGFPSESRRTIADRPDLAPAVALPEGACCCDTTSTFTVREIKQCTAGRGTCLDADWCTPDGRVQTPVLSTLPWVDRCVAVADHFEPWRKNPLWAAEVSPRAQLIADCRSQKWSTQLQSCLLSSGSPLDLDACMFEP